MQVVRDFFIRNKITDTRIAVGVSGGADSLALVLLLKEIFPNLNLVALTVDHKLRPSSTDEAYYVANIMKQHNIEHYILTWEGDKPHTGIEEQARIARYNLLCSWCENNGINYLAIAHHMHDQAETFLMRIERGSGLFGLSSMSEVSEKNGIKILRPLLECAPDELKSFLQDRNISWIEDESNNCNDFLRVKMRKFLHLLEKETGISPKKLCNTVKNLQNTKNFIEDCIDILIKNETLCYKNKGYSFDYTKFLFWHDELKYHLLGKLIRTLANNSYTPEADVLLKTIVEMKDNNFESTTLGGCIIIKNDLKIWIIKEYREKNQNYSNDEWDDFIKQNPEFRGFKLPHKLKIALLKEKK